MHTLPVPISIMKDMINNAMYIVEKLHTFP